MFVAGAGCFCLSIFGVFFVRQERENHTAMLLSPVHLRLRWGAFAFVYIRKHKQMRLIFGLQAGRFRDVHVQLCYYHYHHQPYASFRPLSLFFLLFQRI
jgi:hypothetical protein